MRLAYASIGSGPPLVKASNWLTHLDFEWGSPIWRHWWAALSLHHRVVRYDERGNGMSQRDVPDVSFDTWVRDLETVVDAAGLDRFPLLGISRGGPIAIAYAVKHPERVTHLVLYGAFAAGLNHVGTPDELEARRALVSLMRLGWGLNNPAFCKMFTCRFIPEATPEHEQWFDELQRVSTSPENAARLMERDDDIDVRPLLSQVKTPTLVIHCDRDRAVPPEEGRAARGRDPGRAVRLAAERQSPDAGGGARLGAVPRGAGAVPELVGRFEVGPGISVLLRECAGVGGLSLRNQAIVRSNVPIAALKPCRFGPPPRTSG